MAIERFLEHFDFDGVELGIEPSLNDEIPADVLEHLASKLLEKSPTVRNKIRQRQTARAVTTIVQEEYIKAKRIPKPKRHRETPHEIAIENTAKRINKSIEYVRRMYRATRPPWFGKQD